MDWTVMQREHAEWLARMYPSQDTVVPAAGLVEEAGELTHAVLKAVQRQVWGEEPRHGDLRAKLVDAVGDCAIYVVSFCNAVGWPAKSLFAGDCSPSAEATPLELCGALACAAGEMLQVHTRGTLLSYCIKLRRIAEMLDVPFEQAVADTWAKVKERRRGEKRPKVVCLCGSTRFWREFQEQGLKETLAGNIVLSIGAARGRDDDDKMFGGYMPADEYDDVKRKLDELHLRKVEMADEVLVLNARICSRCMRPYDPGQTDCCYAAHTIKYISESTQRELAHARALGKKVRFLCPE